VPDCRSLRSYFDAFAPAPAWADLVSWPPDIFALANLVLDHTEAYRFVLAPPAGRTWPPLADWNEQVRNAAIAWRQADGKPPPLVAHLWRLLTRDREAPLDQIRSGEAWEATAALLTLHAIADEACARVTSHHRSAGSTFETRAWKLLQEHGSLARLSPSRVRIVPKAHLSGRGITIRSLSRYLGLCYESVEVRWRSAAATQPPDRSEHTLLLVPWPLSVAARSFRGLPSSRPLGNMNPALFGLFEFAPEGALEQGFLDSILAAAGAAGEKVDAVVFPEAALDTSAVRDVERTLARYGISFLIAGVSSPPTRNALGRNYLHFGIRADGGWTHYEQDKHHRWCLDESQIRQYHLSRSLHPGKLWWEAIEIRERLLHIVDMGGGITTTPLICEDLARLDEVADLIRRIGPSLVIAVLLDGPQLATRWACRYASVVADDPGSAVLTLTSLGMVSRSRPPGRPHSRVVAHWNSRAEGVTEIELAPGAAAVLLSLAVDAATLWTADGRRHEGVPTLRLTGVQQLRVGRGTRGRSGTISSDFLQPPNGDAVERARRRRSLPPVTTLSAAESRPVS
jgi:hypothetical protein